MTVDLRRLSTQPDIVGKGCGYGADCGVSPVVIGVMNGSLKDVI